MKNKLRKLLFLFMANIMFLTCLPVNASAFLGNVELESKTVSLNDEIKTPGDLSDGELYTYSAAEAKELPSTEFKIDLSAIGQQYKTTITSSQKFNIVLALDVSNSMDGTRLTNMINAANDAIGVLSGNGNKISVISFATESIVERGLSEKALTLSSSSSTNTSGLTDIIRINLRSNYNLGGTNIQGAINASYKLLRDENDATAIPVIILLSDGAPTYYYTNITNFYNTASNLQGSGGSTETNNIAYTIMQAAYCKALMENLQIYTIPFSTNDAKANATLNPTTTNISFISGLSNTLNYIKNTLSSSIQSKIIYNYPNGSFSATNSQLSLQTALNNIISSMKLKKPIAETLVSGILNESSYVAINYTIGTGYTLTSDNMTVTLNGIAYPFSKASATTFTYNVSPASSSYNAEMAKIIITLNDDVLSWKVPASVLPCNTPEGADQVLASPIKLSFTVGIDNETVLSPGTYNTSSSCTTVFTPVTDNPYYYSTSSVASTTVAENSSITTHETRYFEALYPYLSSGYYSSSNLPVLTGFGVGETSSGIVYTTTPGSTNVTGCYDSSSNDYDTLSFNHEDLSVTLEDISRKTATVAFTTSNTSDPAAYTITSFSDGSSAYADASVIAVNGNDITVRYGGGTRTIVFKNVSFNSSTIYAQAKFKSSNGNDPTNISHISVSSFKVGGSNISSGYTVTDFSRVGHGVWGIILWYTYDITVSYNGFNYSFTDMSFSGSSTSNTSSDNGLSTYSASPSQYYYFSSGSTTYDIINITQNFRYSYNAGTLLIEVKHDGSFVTYAQYTEGENTTIVSDGSGGYTVNHITPAGDSKTILTVSVTPDTLKTDSYTVSVLNGNSEATGIVTKTSTNYGAITFKSAFTSVDYVPSTTLTSLNGSAMASASSSGSASVVLTLTIGTNISDPSVFLGNITTGSPNFEYQITKAVRVSDGTEQNILVSGLLPSSLAEGTYKITYLTKVTYLSDMPDFYYVTFDHMNFGSGLGAANMTLQHEPTYENQQVKVILTSPSVH